MTKKRSLPKMEDFLVPNSNENQKKKVFTENGRLFSPNSSENQRSYAAQSQTIGGDANADQTQIIGGGTVKLLGDISPPGFGTRGR